MSRAERECEVKVLVVDDQADVRLLMLTLLEDAGHEVAELDSGARIIEKATEFSPDVIILDITMPCVDGFAALELLKARPGTRSIPVIMASARANRNTLRRARNLGAADFLPKPWKDGELEWRVAQRAGHGERTAE